MALRWCGEQSYKLSVPRSIRGWGTKGDKMISIKRIIVFTTIAAMSFISCTSEDKRGQPIGQVNPGPSRNSSIVSGNAPSDINDIVPGACYADSHRVSDTGDGCWPFYFSRYTDTQAGQAWDTWNSNSRYNQDLICQTFWDTSDDQLVEELRRGGDSAGYAWAVLDVLWSQC